MVEKSRDPHITAVEAVYGALKALDSANRAKVLASVSALLDVAALPSAGSAQVIGQSVRPPERGSALSRPVSLVELVQEKKPGTNSQRIATFAYYREKHEGLARFHRDDLEAYFAKAKEPPAGNFGRDFVEAVKKGWIHEDAGESYLTSKGLEAVESGFEGERKRSAKRGASKKSKSKKTAKTKKSGKAKQSAARRKSR